jgi:hypothetical protein
MRNTRTFSGLLLSVLGALTTAYIIVLTAR